jgi:hypothetical protein
MGFDKVTIDNLKKVQAIIKHKFKKELAIEEVSAIVNSQFVAANLAFKRKVDVRLPVLGTFVYNHKESINVAMFKLKELKDTITTEAYALHHKQIKEDYLNKKRNKETKKILTIEELKTYNTIIKTSNKYNKCLTDGTEGN